MSRFNKYAHSLISGYVLLGANMIFTLASVPLALHYLSTTEFGLWALTAQVVGYVALVDFGLSVSASRILIDYKDRRAGGEYGGVVQTGALVGLSQGLLVFVVGSVVSCFVGPWLRVPPELEHQFVWLMVGQCALTGVMFAARIFGHLLTAHQRYDITNYAQAILFAANYGVMWLGFARGAGVFSVLWGQAVGTVVAVGFNIWGCGRLKLFPHRGEWGRPTWVKFLELFVFGRDLFLFAAGGQLINASQTLLLTRFMGLETAAVWSVCLRGYTVLTQLIYRIFDYSSAALAEMMARDERPRLLRRFREIVVLSTSLSVSVAALFALLNNTFVQVWTAGKMGWSSWNDLLLALWLMICVSVHANTGLVGQTKAFHFLRYVYFIEGLVFVGLMVLLHRFGGVTLMLGLSIVCSLAFSMPYGLRRTRGYFNLAWADLARWHESALVMLLYLMPVGVLAWWFTRNLSPAARLAVGGMGFGLWNLWVFLRHGLDESLRLEMFQRAPAWIRRILARIGFARA